MSDPVKWTMTLHLSMTKEHRASYMGKYRGVECVACRISVKKMGRGFASSSIEFAVVDARYPNLRETTFAVESAMRDAIDAVLPRVTA